jgi:Methyltransferase domain
MEAIVPGAVGPESRFSAPTHLCPYPGNWHSTDDHSAEMEVSDLLRGLVRGLQPEVVIETGAAWGQTTEALGSALDNNGHGRLYSFEPDPLRARYARSRTSNLPVDVLVTESIGEWEPPGTIGFAFFDSTFPLRVAEFEHYNQWMDYRTIVAFHDTAPQAGGGQLGDWYDLATYIEAHLVATNRLRAISLPTPRGLIIGQVL